MQQSMNTVLTCECESDGLVGKETTEAIHIRCCKGSMNLDSGLHLPTIWKATLDQI